MKKSTHSKEKWLAEKRQAKQKQIQWYLQMGWAVFPVNNQKAPLTQRGCLDASTNPDVIRAWWENFPNANVAIATGRKSQLVVIDIDVKNGKDGLKSLWDTYGEHLEIDYERQRIAKTPSGGFHLYYRWDDALPITNAVGVLPGVDIRGEGGYVVASPSIIKVDDKWIAYEWCDCLQPVPILRDWAWHLLDAHLNRSSSAGVSTSPSPDSRLNVPQVLTGIPQGNRDDQLFRYACHLRGCGVSHDLALGFIRTAAAFCEPPFSDALAIEKVDYAYRNLELNLSLTNEE